MAGVSPGRRTAYEVLLRVFEQEAYADRAFRSAAEGLDERERAFAQRLAYGSVQRVRTLDHAIDTLGRRPVRKLDPPVLAALRLGAYQLGYTDTAAHAAVNESVELVRRARLERAVPFTNAVMRRLSDGIRPLREDAKARARRIDERAIEAVELRRQRRAVRLDDCDVGAPHPREVLPQLARPGRVDLDRGHLSAQLPALPAGSGAEVEHTLAVL